MAIGSELLVSIEASIEAGLEDLLEQVTDPDVREYFLVGVQGLAQALYWRRINSRTGRSEVEENERILLNAIAETRRAVAPLIRDQQ